MSFFAFVKGCVRLFAVAYLSSVLLGWLILQTPFCQNRFVSALDALFIAASAVSTTGLTTLDIGTTFTFSGQLIILLLIQLGGIGYLIFSSIIILNLEQKLTSLRKKIPHSPFSLSKNQTVPSLIKQAAIYTLICEVSGFIILYFFFSDKGIEEPFWEALFHSLSAFCTAGFSLFASNMEGYKDHFGINATLSILSLLGAFGFFLSIDLFSKIKSLKEWMRRVRRTLLSFVFVTILTSTLLFLLTSTFPEESSAFERVVISVFQVISTLTTAGFNTIDMRTLSLLPHLLLIILMLIGVSLTGSGTNMRGTSLISLFRLLKGALANRLLHQKVLLKRSQIALSPFAQYLLVLLVFGSLLVLIENQPFLPLIFETASALCTIGLSMGITPELSALGKSLLIFLMIAGRTGILIVSFTLSLDELSWKQKRTEELAF